MQLYDYALSCLTTSPLLHLYPTYTFSVYSVYSVVHIPTLASLIRWRVDQKPLVVLAFRVFSVFRGSNLCVPAPLR